MGVDALTALFPLLFLAIAVVWVVSAFYVESFTVPAIISVFLVVTFAFTGVGAINSASAVVIRGEPPWQVYAMGDSLTYGGMGIYTDTLSTKLGANWQVKNKGKSGDTAAMGLVRLPADVFAAGDGEYVIIWFGTNDVIAATPAATIQGSLQASYTASHNQGLKVVAVTITPFKGSTGWTEGKQAILDAVNTWILSTAIDVDHRVNLYAVLEDPANPDQLRPEYNSDGSHDWIHLSALGYVVTGETFYTSVYWGVS